jgi:hypothetical protein
MHPKSIRTRSALNAFEKTGPGTGGIAPGAHGGNGGAGAFTGPLLLCTLGLTAAMLESCAAGDHLKGERRQDARVASGCEGFTARASARARGTSVACTQLHGVRRYEVRPQTHTRSLHRNSEELSLYRNSYLRSQGPNRRVTVSLRMQDNSAIREAFLASARKEEAASARAPSAEERARKKEKAQASYERRMAIQRRREEAVAEASCYTDRAAVRRQEESRQQREGGAAHQTFWDEAALTKELPAHEVSNAPTFAQLGEREDLSQQRHRVSIEQSKYLGGDIEHTHLVKGLDFALLQKTRSELQGAEGSRSKDGVGARQTAQSILASSAGSSSKTPLRVPRDAPKAPKTMDAMQGGAPAAKPPAGVVGSTAGGAVQKLEFVTDLGRDVYRAIFREGARPNRALYDGRLVLAFDASPNSPSDVPSSHVRASDDLGRRPRMNEQLCDAGTPDDLIPRLSKVLARHAGSGVIGRMPPGGRKGNREKPTAGTGRSIGGPAVLTMRPLHRAVKKRGRGDANSKAVGVEADKVEQLIAHAGERKAGSAAGLEGSSSLGEPKTCKSGSSTAQPAVPTTTLTEDIDDIFGDGVGSDYVCKPSEAQLAKAARDAGDARLLREAVSELPLEHSNGARVDEDTQCRSIGGETAPSLGWQEQPAGEESEAALLLKNAMAEKKSSSRKSEGLTVVEDEDADVADASLLRASKTKKAGAQAPTGVGKDLKMHGGAMDDSYGECFPDTVRPLPGLEHFSPCLPSSRDPLISPRRSRSAV